MVGTVRSGRLNPQIAARINECKLPQRKNFTIIIRWSIQRLLLLFIPNNFCVFVSSHNRVKRKLPRSCTKYRALCTFQMQSHLHRAQNPRSILFIVSIHSTLFMIAAPQRGFFLKRKMSTHIEKTNRVSFRCALYLFFPLHRLQLLQYIP